jgi:poly(ADP-ribose) glycohydrolase
VTAEADGSIEKQENEAHVDFANCFIGGGVLTSGLVQEEIRFMIAPETLISCLLCEKMTSKEAIILLGTQQYSNYKGYRNSFMYKPRETSTTVETRSSLGHYPSCLIAIDAMFFINSTRQFLRKAIDREIRKVGYYG